MTGPNVNTFVPGVSELNNFSLPQCEPGSHIIIAGAGSFGGWTALSLLRKKFNVTLVDGHGPGSPKSSSGDETRVIRSTYGKNEVYFDLNVRALKLWKAFEKQSGKSIFINKGVLWLCHEKITPMVDDSISFARKHEMEYEYISSDNLLKRYPVVNGEDIHHAYLDPFGGYLLSKESCRLVKETFVNEGGTYISSFVKYNRIYNNKLSSVWLTDNTELHGDHFIFACGAWLGSIFPDLLKDIIIPSRQEVYYFNVPETRIDSYRDFPVWVDVDGKDFYYGIPSDNGRVFKIGVDKRGETIHPDHDDRLMNQDVFNKARTFISHRFPDLRNAPLIDSRVCAYENSPDGNFIIDQHPDADNILILGGGSGHGFKHGPAIGELISQALCEGRKIPGLFSLNRFM